MFSLHIKYQTSITKISFEATNTAKTERDDRIIFRRIKYRKSCQNRDNPRLNKYLQKRRKKNKNQMKCTSTLLTEVPGRQGLFSPSIVCDDIMGDFRDRLLQILSDS
ncbi:hypothetical protein CEXT_520451 [Caerostris extrusa]|uniref:Uncharacterized protein n=1 Tax=Caerostris extrusa TaxID=172846 RepID=A0AAV4N287_CAEEX|nr:hypothetical protein CEXT_520451 [Caerostris extrusa]